MIDNFDSLAQRFKQTRFNPLQSLTPRRLAAALDSGEAGWLRELGLILEAIGKRDAICRTVLGKRKAAVSRRPVDVLIHEGEEENPRAMAHKEALEYFYRNLTVTDATDLNLLGGVSGLVRQMMDSVLQRYSVHEIVWRPGKDGLSAELRWVPIYFFENRSGRLRFTGPENRADGMPLEEDGWMTTVAESSVGEALSICYMFRRLAIQDWTAFNEKFSIPGVLGRTKAAKDSPEGVAFRDAVADFGSEWHGVMYNDDGTVKEPLQIIQTAASSGLPQKEMCEYMDRMITILCRGGDLGTLSREDSQGASLQGDESDALLEDDCSMISETLRMQLDARVIRMVFGDEKPLAYAEVQPPSTEDNSRELSIDQGLAALGVVQSPEVLAERYGRTHEENAETLKAETRKEEAAPIEITEMPEEAANEAEVSDPVMQLLRSIHAAGLQGLGRQLETLMQGDDVEAGAKALSKKLGEYLAAAGFEEALGVALAESFLEEKS